MNLQPIIDAVHAKVRGPARHRAALVGVSGIDGSGKSFLAARLHAGLRGSGLRVAALSVDDWLDLPAVRFSEVDPAGTFYRRGLRLEAMYRDLVVPLRDRRGADLYADLLRETAPAFHRAHLHFEDVDVVLLEGIFLLKRAYQRLFDLALWIDCMFDTALARAVRRSQEGLDEAATVAAYQRIYFPAQRLHFAIDDPVSATDFTIRNDERIPAGLRRRIACGSDT